MSDSDGVSVLKGPQMIFGFDFGLKPSALVRNRDDNTPAGLIGGSSTSGILAPDRSEMEMTPEAASSKIRCFNTLYPSKADNSDPLGQKPSHWAESHAFRSFYP